MFGASGQELFINTEPASSVPHKALIVRGFTQWYDEFGAVRGMGAMSFYYGLTPRLSVNFTVAGSNHHGKYLPEDLITHKHVGYNTIYYSQPVARNNRNPFLVKGINTSFKYRFISIDEHRKHFRAAVTGTYSTSKSAHDEAEANLLDDNAGYGAGLIATYLNQRFAISFNYQYIIPKPFEQEHDDEILRLEYSHNQQLTMALGYLLSPKEYQAYEQTNTNLYLELVGKSFKAVDIYRNDELIAAESLAHMGSYYVEVQPGIQKVYNSKTLLEFSVGLPLVRASFSHSTPTYLLSLRRYIFL